ncbi:hypothetical protein DAMA08_038080 [Martiniozyma asiatica (nom. inval.)]|nr:hypothetical protein DAMA08_038080 [Martiniozyma asiatica]
MIPSNILQVFNPPTESKEILDEELCLPCQVIGSLTAITGGLYFASGLPFKGDFDFKKSPKYWRNMVRFSGLPILALGIYRGGEGWLWNKDIKYKENWF